MRRFFDLVQARRFFARVSPGEVRSLATLAVPVTASISVGMITQLANTAILAPLGEQALAIAAMSWNAYVLIVAVISGLLAVVPVSIGHAFGAGEDSRVSDLARGWNMVALVAGASAALLFIAGHALLPALGQPVELVALSRPYWIATGLTFLTYPLFSVQMATLESIGRPWTAFRFTAATVALSAPLSLFLTHGLGAWAGLGPVGAPLGVFAAGLVICLALWGNWRFAKSFERYRLQPDDRRESWRLAWREGLPSAVQYSFEGAAFAFCGMMIGWLGVTALAAHQIVMSVGGLLYVVPLALSYAVSIRVAQAAGGRERDRVLSIGLAGLIVVAVVMAAATLVILVGGPSLAAALARSGPVAALAAAMLVAYGVMQLFDGLQTVAVGALRGLLDVRFPALVSILAYWGLAVPLSYLLAFRAGLGGPGIWYGFGIGLLIVSIALVRRFWTRAHAA